MLVDIAAPVGHTGGGSWLQFVIPQSQGGAVAVGHTGRWCPLEQGMVAVGHTCKCSGQWVVIHRVVLSADGLVNIVV